MDRTDLCSFSVAPMNGEALPVLTQNRVQLERLAPRASTARLDSAMEDQLLLLLHRPLRAVRSLSVDHWVTHPAWERLHLDVQLALLPVARVG